MQDETGCRVPFGVPFGLVRGRTVRQKGKCRVVRTLSLPWIEKPQPVREGIRPWKGNPKLYEKVSDLGKGIRELCERMPDPGKENAELCATRTSSGKGKPELCGPMGVRSREKPFRPWLKRSQVEKKLSGGGHNSAKLFPSRTEASHNSWFSFPPWPSTPHRSAFSFPSRPEPTSERRQCQAPSSGREHGHRAANASSALYESRRGHRRNDAPAMCALARLPRLSWLSPP